MFGFVKKLFAGGGGKERRREEREELSDGTVSILGDPYPLKNWSSTGFLAGACDLGLEEGQEVSIAVSVPLEGERLEFRCQALVVEANAESRELSAMFVMLDPEARAQIDRHFGVFPMG
ncbi:MAG: hypothetical protein V3S87_03995 [Alphaproteobacteria bacterium]